MNNVHRNESAGQLEQNTTQEVSRRSFIAMTGGLALATGSVGEVIGEQGEITNQSEVANQTENSPPQEHERVPIDPANPTIVREEHKCILCGKCGEVCEREQAVMGHYELPLINDYIPCIGCGQCALWCPTDSIVERDDTQRLREALNNPDLHVVAQTAPSTRVGLGEAFGLRPGENVQGEQVAALRALGFNAVLDTAFSADLTIMEEATELVKRLTGKKDAPVPMFTSCCPGWIKFCELFYPELIPNLSSALSPMGMLASVIKTYYAEKQGIAPEKIFSVAIMPCTAKKFEAIRPEMNNAGVKHGKPEIRGIDLVITTRELARMIRQRQFFLLGADPDTPYDDMLSEYTGGGAIFGVTGGVMEAAVRSAYYFITGENPPPSIVDLKPVRGLAGIKDATLEIPGIGEIRVAVVSGTANARRVLEKVKSGEVNWHFIEFMACSGGCISGGGQPKTAVPPSDVVRAARIGALYSIDERSTIRLSHENPQIKALYENFLGKPYGELASKLLHTRQYEDRSKHLTAKK